MRANTTKKTSTGRLMHVDVVRKPGSKKPSRHWKEQTDTLLTVASMLCQSSGHKPPGELSELSGCCGDCLADTIARALQAAAEGKLNREAQS